MSVENDIYGGMHLNELRDQALKTAKEHGFTDATIGEDIALMHSELSEALEDHRAGRPPTAVWYVDKNGEATTYQSTSKPCGIPSEMADTIIRILHFCGKHGIDIDRAIVEKMRYNESRPYKNGNKIL